jgi:hypothetical protein
MERELWPQLYRLVMEAGKSFRVGDVTYQPHIILLVLLWAALHDRPICWACDERNWSTTTLRPATIPSASTLSRRLRRLDTAMFVREVVARFRGPAPLWTVVDGKPLPVGGASGDPEARWGWGVRGWAKGYKLYAIWGDRPVPEAYRLYPMNRSEDEVAAELAREAAGGGYLLGDGLYDSSPVFDAVGAAGYQLVAPREKPDAGLGHHYQSPYRLHCIDLMRTDFGRNLFGRRPDIERAFADLTSFGGGLAPLPAWVRHEHRVWMWVTAKILINAERIMRNKRLAA